MMIENGPVPVGTDRAPRNLYVAVERRRHSPKSWTWAIRKGDDTLVEAGQGYAGAEEAWEAAQRELRRRTTTFQ